jgi:Zn ribbon nucleic-acid-binding protein
MVVGKEMLRKYHFPHTSDSCVHNENLTSLKFVAGIKCTCFRHENLLNKYNDIIIYEGYEKAYNFLQKGLKKIYREDQQNEEFVGIFSD